MTTWSHIPNAVHIDQVLVDLNNHPAKFEVLKDSTWDVAYNGSWQSTWNAVKDSAWNSSWDPAKDQVGGAAWGAVLALVAYDDAGEYMTMPPRQALVWGELRGDPAYILLRPYLRVRAQVLVDIN